MSGSCSNRSYYYYPYDYSSTSSTSGTNSYSVELSDHICQEVSVEDFLTHIWGISPRSVKSILEADITPPLVPLREYRNVLNRGAQACKPFREISDQLLLNVCTILRLGSRTGFSHGGSNEAVKGFCTSRQPDLVPGSLPLLLMKLGPSNTLFEVKYHFKERLGSVDIQASEVLSVTAAVVSSASHEASTGIATSRVKNSSPTSHPQRLMGSISCNPTKENVPNTSHAPNSRAYAGIKRSRDEEDDSKAAFPNKRPKTEGKMTDDQLQLATRVLATVGCFGRSYVTGIVIDRFHVSIWYLDRVSFIHSANFALNTSQGAKYLALCLFARERCSMQQAGFYPHIHRFIPPVNTTTPVTDACIQPLDRATTVENDNLCFVFPKNCSEEKSLENDPQYIFKIKKILFDSREIVGRGTLVASIRVYILNECLYRDHYVIKLSWQDCGKKPEGDILGPLCKALPYWKRHLPNPLFSAKYTPEELNIPRLKMKIQELEKLEKIQDRDLHAVVSERYFKLWEAESVEEFKRAFLDCLECHYHVYHTGRVLHRDISENNLMIWRPIKVNEQEINELGLKPTTEGACEERSTESLGILNDFDMAAEVGDDGELLAARRRTGTLPFIARDLLAPTLKGDPSPKHLYRHDLESFFYVLVWAAAHYDFGTKTRHPTSEVSKKWDEEDRSHVFKCVLMTNIAYYRDLRSLARPENHDLCLEWIEPLHKLFFRAQLDMMTHDIYGKRFDYDTYNGKITFVNFMAAIGETPRGLEANSYKFL